MLPDMLREWMNATKTLPPRTRLWVDDVSFRALADYTLAQALYAPVPDLDEPVRCVRLREVYVMPRSFRG